MSYQPKNYQEQGGEKTVIGGELNIKSTGKIKSDGEIEVNGELNIESTGTLTSDGEIVVNGELNIGEEGTITADGEIVINNELNIGSTGKITANGTQADHIADAKVDYEEGDLDTEAEIIAAFNSTNTTINAILAALEGVGILKTS